MTSELQRYLDFLSYCLNEQNIDSPIIKGMDWQGLYRFSQEQAIVGIVLAGIDHLSKSQKLDVPRDLLFEWIGQGNMIESRNKLVNQRVQDLTQNLSEKGQQCCILKGQGNALMYPNPAMRTPGDIDVWIKGTKKEVVDFVHQRFPDMNVQYHHMEYPIFDDVEVEVHYYPSFCYNKWYNHRLLQFFQESSQEQFSNINTEGYASPTVVFNLVFQLSHMMRHFFTQGIGLRHAIDYYYLLKQDITQEEIREVVSIVKSCGMYKFFCALLWIEKSILGLDKTALFAPVNERAGKLVLHEMLKGGNFGHSYNHVGSTALVTFAMQMKYNLRYVSIFPLEPLSRPLTLVLDYIKKHFLVIWK